MSFTPPPAAYAAGAQVAAQIAVQRTVHAKACVCHHARADHVNQGRCLDRLCGCRKFRLPEPDPQPEPDIGT